MNSVLIDLGGRLNQEVRVHRRRELLAMLVKKFRISQREISRRTKALNDKGRGIYVDPHQLNKFLKGDRDLYAQTVEAIEIALTQVCPQAGAYYQAELTKMFNEIQVLDDEEKQEN